MNEKGTPFYTTILELLGSIVPNILIPIRHLGKVALKELFLFVFQFSNEKKRTLAVVCALCEQECTNTFLNHSQCLWSTYVKYLTKSHSFIDRAIALTNQISYIV